MKKYYIYILLCNDKSYYTGITNCIETRFQQHRDGINPTSFTYTRRPLRLVYVEEFFDVWQAIRREKQLKKWSRAKKQALIKENLQRLIVLSKNRTQFPLEK